MFNSVKYLLLLIISAVFLSCSGKSDKPVIKFSGDSSSIVIKNINQASLFEIKKTMQANPDSIKFISVLVTPGDEDSLQDEKDIFGKILLKGDSIIFVPQQTFIKGKTYLVESYIGVKFADGSKLFKGTITHNLKPQIQMLKR